MDEAHALQEPLEHHPSAVKSQSFAVINAYKGKMILDVQLQIFNALRFIGVVESTLHERRDIHSSWPPILWTITKTMLQDERQILLASPMERCSPIFAVLLNAVIDPDTDLLLRLYPPRYLVNL